MCSLLWPRGRGERRWEGDRASHQVEWHSPVCLCKLSLFYVPTIKGILYLVTSLYSNLITFSPLVVTWVESFFSFLQCQKRSSHILLQFSSLIPPCRSIFYRAGKVEGCNGRTLNHQQEALSWLMQYNCLDIDWPLFVRFTTNQL